MILDLQEKGVIQLLYNKWWKNPASCIREDKNKEGKANALGVVRFSNQKRSSNLFNFRNQF